jgi:DNA-binding NtrC family response regulator
MKRILIVDDDSAIGRMLSTILEQDGHAVVAVTSAAAALDHLEANDVDVVFSEFCVDSPLNGLQLCALIGRQWPRVRFFLGTRFVGLDPAAARACRVEAILEKPYHLADLRRVACGPRRLAGRAPLRLVDTQHVA